MGTTAQMVSLSRYLYAKAAAGGVPLGGTFELTPLCNLRCKMCYVRLTPQQLAARGRLHTAEEWLALARQAKEKGLLFLLLTGGEPFAYNEFIPLYTKLKDMGFVLSINTNGTLIDRKMADFLIENPPQKLNITLYGADNETYERLCGDPHGFDKVAAAVTMLKAAGLFVKLNVSITPDNAPQLQRLYAQAKAWNVPVQMSSYMFPPLRRTGECGHNDGRLPAAQAGRLLLDIDRLRFTEQQFAARYPVDPAEEDDCGSMRAAEAFTCRAGRSSFWISWDGKMSACGMIPALTVPLSSYEEGFAAAWEEVNRMTGAAAVLHACADCPLRTKCYVCPAMAYAETGDFNGRPAYVCDMTRAMYGI